MLYINKLMAQVEAHEADKAAATAELGKLTRKRSAITKADIERVMAITERATWQPGQEAESVAS